MSFCDHPFPLNFRKVRKASNKTNSLVFVVHAHAISDNSHICAIPKDFALTNLEFEILLMELREGLPLRRGYSLKFLPGH